MPHKLLLLLIFLLCLSINAFSQNHAPAAKVLSIKKLKERVIEKVLPVPRESLGNYCATGTIRVFVTVDENGEVASAKISGDHFEPVREQVESSVRKWKFGPLEENGKKLPFRGVIVLYLHWGGNVKETSPEH